MSVHNQCIGATDEWYTPPHVFGALGVSFDLDVAHPGLSVVDWIPAFNIITEASLQREWNGMVWMNAPFGGRNGLVPWLDKFFQHGQGIALTPDRTSAPWWQDFAPRADCILLTRGKLRFIGRDGKPGKSPADGTTLMALGDQSIAALERAEASGLGLCFKNWVGA